MHAICYRDKCQGHGCCELNAPEVFQLDDLGYNNCGEFEVPVHLEDAARDGAASCPEGAIKIIE